MKKTNNPKTKTTLFSLCSLFFLPWYEFLAGLVQRALYGRRFAVCWIGLGQERDCSWPGGAAELGHS